MYFRTSYYNLLKYIVAVQIFSNTFIASSNGIQHSNSLLVCAVLNRALYNAASIFVKRQWLDVFDYIIDNELDLVHDFRRPNHVSCVFGVLGKGTFHVDTSLDYVIAIRIMYHRNYLKTRNKEVNEQFNIC